MKRFLIILRGAPGTGKSTIAKNLCDFQKRIVWLKVDLFKRIFADESTEALEYANLTAISTLKFLLDNNFSVVMEGVFQNLEHVGTALQIAKEQNIPAFVFELTCSIEELNRRDENREEVKNGWRKPLGTEVITYLINKIQNSRFVRAARLDTEKLSIDDCVNKIKAEVGYGSCQKRKSEL